MCRRSAREGPRDTSSAMWLSCQTREGPRQHALGHAFIVPSLATTTAKASERVIASPPGWGRRGLGTTTERARGAVCVY